MEEFKPQIPKEMLQHASFESTKEAQMSLRTHWGIWLSAGVILAIIVSLCVALIPQPGRVHPYNGYPGASESDSDSNPSVLSFNPSEPSVSGFSPESSQVHFSSPKPTPPTNEADLPSSYSPATQDTAQITMRDLEGTYSATSNGVTMTLTIYDADSDTAYARLSSTNAGTSSCVAALLGGTVSLVFSDHSELRLRRNGTTSLTFIDSGITLRKR